MAQIPSISEDATSYPVHRSTRDINGFCEGYPLRRHKFEAEANKGSVQCRDDWEKYIGPIERWGSCNPWEGHFSAVVLPLCMPERIAIISYVFEYAFLYDSVVESVAKCTLNSNADNIALDEAEYRTVRSVLGTKQIQSKMVLELLSIDRECAEVVISSWKTMISTTAKRNKTRPFDSLEEYVDYRIIDTGAPFVDTLMRFGMGFQLTPEEEERVALIVKPCYAALGLANDYFSFDVEWEEFQTKEKQQGAMTNAVWLFMQWEDLDIPEAKRRVRHVTNQYEKEYQRRVAAFVEGDGKNDTKLKTYLRALGYQIPGNVVWSLRCPRYHPELCDEAGRLLRSENSLHLSADEEAYQDPGGRTRSPSVAESRASDEVSTGWSSPGRVSVRTSISSAPALEELSVKGQAKLSDEHLLRPAEYISSLPSKGVREAFIDGLNVWLVLPDHRVNQLKTIAQTLHNASLMLDDIEDSSPLRRGQPATHMVFGIGPTINSANFLLIQAADQVRQLDDSRCLDIYMEELRNLFIGQSYDLFWTQKGECPEEEEYREMIRQKTGGLFRLLTRLMTQLTPLQHTRLNTPLESLSSLLGEVFQIRDDYKNLTEEYTGQKGFCEDLDEGKFSFPLIHALTSGADDSQLRGLMQQSRTSGGLDVEQKECVLENLRRSGSMSYTEEKMQELMERVGDTVGLLEAQTGCSNWVLRLLIHRLGG